MAQRRYFNRLDDDSTFDINVRLVGLLSPGFYRGFDFIPAAGMNLVLAHSETGYQYPKRNQSGFSNWLGVFSTQQGVVIVEDEVLTLPIAPNEATTARLDSVVVTHRYSEIEGGEQATYSVRKGAPAASADLEPEAPGVLNPMTDMLVGTLYLPAGTASLTAPGVAWNRTPTPLLADDESRLPYVFSRFNNIGVVKASQNGRTGYDIFLQNTPLVKTETATPDANALFQTGFYSLDSALNVPTSAQWHYLEVHAHSDAKGSEYTSQVAHTLTGTERGMGSYRRACMGGTWTGWRRLDTLLVGGKDNANFNDYIDSGIFRIGGTPSNGPAFKNSNLWTLLVTGVFDVTHQIATEQNSLSANVWSRTFSAYFNNGGGGWTAWRRMDTGDVEGRVKTLEDTILELLAKLAEKADRIPPGVVWDYVGTLSPFDATGKGKPGTLLDGWALCNGQNGTQDRRGRTVIGYHEGYGSEPADITNYPIKGYVNYGRIGNIGGSMLVGLTVDELPAHDHAPDGQFNYNQLLRKAPLNSNSTATTADGNGNGGNEPDILSSQPIQTVGTGSQHENRMPYIVTGWIQRLV